MSKLRKQINNLPCCDCTHYDSVYCNTNRLDTIVENRPGVTYLYKQGHPVCLLFTKRSNNSNEQTT